MFDTVRFFRLPKMFHLPNKSNSRGLSSSEVLDFFELLGLSQVTEDDCWLFCLSNFQMLTSRTMFDLMSYFRRYSDHALTVLESDLRRSGVQQCKNFPEVITDNRRCSFRLTRRISKDYKLLRHCSICWIRGMAEDVRQRSIFLRDYPRCRFVLFRRFQKIRRVYHLIEWYSDSEFLNWFPVLPCVYAKLDSQDSVTYRHQLSLE